MAKRKSTESEPLPTKKPTKSNPETSLTICIPSTVISSKNAYNLQQITSIVYQIARAACTYKVAEIVVFDVPKDTTAKEEQKVTSSGKVVFGDDDEPKNNNKKEEDEKPEDGLLVASLLQFFITPPYLVKTMFSAHLNKNFKNILPKFKYAFKLPKITTLPFMQNNEDFKEGMIIPRETPLIKKKNKKVKADHKITVSKYVNIGEKEPLKLEIKREIPIYSRVTVDLKNKTIVSPLQAYGVIGHKAAFGYHVRMVSEFNKIFTQSPIADGYSSTVFVNAGDYFGKGEVELSEHKESNGNVLMIISSMKELQVAFKNDTSNVFESIKDVKELFDCKLSIPNGCRIEDAVMIGLTKLVDV
ncbi:LOW QUALITY PROTEIN: YMR310C putative methyltransferase YMR310C [Candida maltosa Xu316]